MIPTLEDIKAAEEKLEKMRAAYYDAQTRVITIPAMTFELREGEIDAGLILGKDGARDYRLILSSSKIDRVQWDEAMERSVEAGGELPTLEEQTFLRANLSGEFKGNYWSNEQCEESLNYAMTTQFSTGCQHDWHKSMLWSARAVRRVFIKGSK